MKALGRVVWDSLFNTFLNHFFFGLGIEYSFLSLSVQKISAGMFFFSFFFLLLDVWCLCATLWLMKDLPSNLYLHVLAQLEAPIFFATISAFSLVGYRLLYNETTSRCSRGSTGVGS